MKDITQISEKYMEIFVTIFSSGNKTVLRQRIVLNAFHRNLKLHED